GTPGEASGIGGCPRVGGGEGLSPLPRTRGRGPGEGPPSRGLRLSQTHVDREKGPSPGLSPDYRGEEEGPHPNPLPEYGAREKRATFTRRAWLGGSVASLVAIPAILRAACPCASDDEDKDRKDVKAAADARTDGPATQPATQPAV